MITVQILNIHIIIDSDISLLGDPFFEEKGRIVSRRVLSVEPEVQIEYVIFLNGIINGPMEEKCQRGPAREYKMLETRGIYYLVQHFTQLAQQESLPSLTM